VYRTLATFDEMGLVKRLHVMNERTLFDTNVDIHHHFICIRCKAVKDIYWSEFDNRVLPPSVEEMGDIQSRHLEIHGVCRRCIEEAG
jgi:Fur family peroxide stress response transcriptional regulator